MDKQQYAARRETTFISSLAITESITEFGISSIFSLFLMHVLHFSIHLSSTTYSYYYSIAYILPIFAGLISDKHLNKIESLKIGFISMIISQFLLFLSASMYYPSSVEYTSISSNLQNILFIGGLIFLAIGTSFASNTLSNIISLIGNEFNTREINLYSIYYTFINFGVIIGILIMTFIVGNSNYFLFKWTFLIFAIILIIGFIVFLYGKDRFLPELKENLIEKNYSNEKNENKQKFLKNANSKIKSAVNVIIHMKSRLSNSINSLTKIERDRLILFIMILIFIIIYRIGYHQTSASMILFNERYVLRNYGFLTLPVQLFSIFNPIFIILFTPLYTKFNKDIIKRNGDYEIVTRIGVGLLLMAISFIILSCICYQIDIGMKDKINMAWIILYEIIIAISELFLSVTGYSMVAKLAPAKYFAVYFGMFQSTHAIARYIVGFIISIFPLHKTHEIFFGAFPLNGLCDFFLILAIPSLICGIIIFFKRKSLEKMVHYEDP